MIAQQGKIPQSWAPYFPEQSSFTYPPGYPSVIAFLYLLDPSGSMPVLVSLFSVFFAIVHSEIFVLTRRVLHDDRIAICATAFSALLSVGFYQMIITGRFPGLVGLALTLNLLLFSYLYSITGKRRLLLLAGITLASLFLTYTVSFITASLFVILFFSFRLVFFKHRKESIFGGATIIFVGIVLSLPWVLNIIDRLMVRVPTREYDALLAWFDLYSVRSEIGPTNPAMYYGYWLFLFGIMGLLIVLVRKRSGSFLLAWLLSISLLMLNEIFKIPFPGWYYLQSGAFLNPTLSLPLSVLAGIGFVKAYDFLKKRLHFSSKSVKISLYFVLVVTLLISTVVFGAKTIADRAALQTNRISSADYNAIMWISNNTYEDAVIFNDYWVGTPSTWIPVISHRRVVMPLLSISEVGWTNIMFTRQDESMIVATDPNSTEALSILKRYDASYVYLSNNVSAQVQEWRNNFDSYSFLQSSHYELAFNEDNAWVFRVIY
jgi:MFS family permease